MGAMVLGGWEPFAELGEGAVPEFRYGWVPKRLGLATRRQLRARGMSPGRQPVAARVVWGRRPGGQRARPDGRVRYGDLYLVELARPKRAHSPAAEAARQRAMLRRRTCDVVEHQGDRDTGRCVPKVSLGGCHACWVAGKCEGSQGPCPVEEVDVPEQRADELPAPAAA